MAARKVSAPHNLEWTVKRQLLSDWMRPLGIEAASRQHMHGPADSLTGNNSGWNGLAVLFGLLWTMITLPLLPIVLLLRQRGLLPWTINAIARPWGRRGPATVLRYHVRGKEEADAALEHLVTRLQAGDGAPLLPGAERLT
jgi:hypothetical protein